MRNLSFCFSVFLLVIVFCLTTNSSAQVSAGGSPPSFALNLRNDIQTIIMPALDREALLREDEIEQQAGDVPLRFGYPFPEDIGLTNTGTWEDLADGSRLWRLQINSPGAYSINLIYDEFWLPEEAALFIYNPDQTMVLGAFTADNNKPHGRFATGPVKGDRIILEYHEPADVSEPGRIHISTVVHAYRDMFDLIKNYGESGACNNNVNCPEGAGWQSERRSVAMVILGNGTRWCSGALINNTTNDFTPYFLTANHCVSGQDTDTWIFMFNYESPTCTNTDGPINQTISGCTLVANNGDSDFALVRLDETPPSTYNAYYSGWSRSTTAATSAVGIHHPSGDIKKISFENNAVVTSDYDPAPYLANSHWELVWDDGTTEGGSSGSPLFDPNHRIVGQLHGGGASCTNPTAADFYGKFSMSWDRGGAHTTRLREWLDPIGSGVTTLNGINQNLPDLTIQNSSANPTTVGQGANTTITYTYRNQGSGNASPALTRFYFSNDATLSSDDTQIGSRYELSRPANTSSVRRKTIRIPTNASTGTRYLFIVADSGNQVAETNEGNNQQSVTITVQTTTTGFARVDQGVTVTLWPNNNAAPIPQNNYYNVTARLREMNGASITFERVTCALLDANNNMIRDLCLFQNVTIAANGTWSYTCRDYMELPAGTYKLILRGKVPGGSWVDFQVTGSGVNPRTFSVSNGGFARIDQGVTVSPSPVPLNSNFTITARLREMNNAQITLREVKAVVLNASNQEVRTMTIATDVVVPALGTANYSASTTANFGTGNFQAMLRGRVNIGFFNIETTGSGVNPRTFAVQSTTTGFARIDQGVSVTLWPNNNAAPIPQNNYYNVSARLIETNGASITFERITCALLDANNNMIRDLCLFQNVTIAANGTWSYSCRDYMELPAGTYKLVLRGKIPGGSWFDFQVTGSGVNPRTFSVSNGGFARIDQGVTVSPSPVPLNSNFTVTARLREMNNAQITLREVKAVVLNASNQEVRTMTIATDVVVPALGIANYSASTTANFNTGNFQAVLRGRVNITVFNIETTGSGVNPRSFSVTTSVITIWLEGFETNSVPGTYWSANDANSTNGYDYWGDQSVSTGARAHTGNWSMYCADNSDISGQVYDDYMAAYATKINGVNVSGYSNVQFRFWLWFNTEYCCDYVALEYIDNSGVWVEYIRWRGNGAQWAEQSFTLTNFITFNFRFKFYTDGSVRYEGVYIDDIIITGSPTAITAPSGELIVETIEITNGVENESQKPQTTSINTPVIAHLGQNHPNPFNPATIIPYQTPASGLVSLRIYNISGQLVKTLVYDVKEAGLHEAVWNGDNDRGETVDSGVYLYQMEADNDNFRQTRRMTLIK